MKIIFLVAVLPIATDCRPFHPSRHQLIGSKAEDVYYFDNIGNLMDHKGTDFNGADFSGARTFLGK